MIAKLLKESAGDTTIQVSKKRRLTNKSRGMDMVWKSEDEEWENTLESGSFHDEETNSDMNYVLATLHRNFNGRKYIMYAKKFTDPKEARRGFEQAGRTIDEPSRFQRYLLHNGFVRVSKNFLG